ncbi:MAG: ABC transporter ATP-binding protein [Thermoplasmata archaeon]|nr:ABC transporter ATP-binding protein [Thermoplasmata archaeon]
MALLEVEDLKVYFEIVRGQVKAVDGVSFKLEKGETMGLVGESGCGKTTAAFAITRLLPDNGDIVGGTITFDGRVIAGSEEEKSLSKRKKAKYVDQVMREIRWDEVSMIFQSAMNAFNPVQKVGDQIAEAILAHDDVTKQEARKKVLELFKLVGLDVGRVDGYPHEYSGGMRQRGMIAMALACNPQLIIADEPTTALDVIMQDRVLAEIRDLQRRLGMAMIIITHDISVVAEVSKKIAIMYAGRLMEYGDITAIFESPSNPYSIGLLASFPSIIGEKKPLYSIPGSPPDLAHPPPGCRFHPRCKYAKSICKEEVPELIEVEPNHRSACHFALEIFNGQLSEVSQ